MDHVLEFEKYLKEDGKRDSTILSYTGDVRGFLDYLASKGSPFHGQIVRFYITSYKEHLGQLGYKVNTINKKINSLVCFNQFLLEREIMDRMVVDLRRDKIRVAHGSEQEVEVYTENEVERLLFYIQDTEKVSVRDKLIVLLLLYTGIRVSELVSIRLKDLDFLTMQLQVVGKGGKIREVPLRSEVVDVAKEYMATERRGHKFSGSEYLLLTQRSGKMDRDAVNKLLNKHGEYLGITMRPHKFRHTFCTRLLKAGVPLTTTAKIAGHARIQTTAAFYINTSRQDKQEAVDLL
ncbi:MAG: tyrosine-type recombinase/integrase [Clostridiales bacterium]|nr:tyrosine-type recombinase/integrase [Clostridiales bacterium]